ncbi:uncharacterized protein LOC119682407 [Teleopsis dalmanni]|uniref:uncharacterized protein LOC119682407 n=1 Tax=Teleopsis dalmanni TaxID=139649 RepID=UPI0018CD9129|nr:uncharacterized protein LOC119682407 [Teleopsis dalmanni]
MNLSNSIRRLNYIANDLEGHMRFICPECGKEHQSQVDWRKHLNEEHNYNNKEAKDFNFREINDKYHECQTCFQWVANAHQSIALLQYHRFLHLPFSSTYQCRHCDGSYTRKRALCEHLLRYHTLKIKPKKADIEAEKKIARDPKENSEFYLRFICPQCGHLFERQQQWLYHVNNVHYVTSADLKMRRLSNSRSHCCVQCKKLFCTDDKTILQSHRFSHLPYKNYFQCAFCSFKKTLKTDILHHFICAHVEEYEKAKMYMKVPDEWGATISESYKQELEKLLYNANKKICSKSSTNKTKTDLIQKAMMNSFINLDENEKIKVHNLSPKKMDRTQLFTNQQQSKNINMQKNVEFDEICSTFFEEIEHNSVDTEAAESLLLKEEIKIESEDENENEDKNEEKIVSIEIDAINSVEESETDGSPQRKRFKTNEHYSTADNVIINPKRGLEQFIKYLCPQCGEQLENQKLWRQHVFNDHDLNKSIENNFRIVDDKNSYLCLECMEVLNSTSSAEMQRHYFQHMPYRSYLRCAFCVRTKSSKFRILNHLQSCHKQQIGQSIQVSDSNNPFFKCMYCEKEFCTQTLYQNHRSQCILIRRNAKTDDIIAKNSILLEHLKEASERIKRIMQSM